LLKLKTLPTAVICSNDLTAIGVLRALTLARLRIPEDISVIGFDDIHLAEFVYPPLTTVHMSRTAIARAAFETLRNIVDYAQPGKKEIGVIPTRLTVRQSTVSIPGSRKSPPAKSAPARKRRS
jgi:LacI family transcriptional regulator